MFKIGDFSKLSQVSIKALRLYDRLGLLKPIQIDPLTSYRYYSAKQLPRLNRILSFKDLGFSLGQIAQLLDDDISLEQIRGMLRLKQAELQQSLELEKSRLARVEARIKHMEEDKMTNYDIVLKKAEPLKVASIRETLPNYAAVGHLFTELLDYLHQHQPTKFDRCITIWHDPDYRESNIDGEAVVSVDNSFISDTDRIKVYELPGYEAIACIIHHGSYLTLSESYQKILAWIEDNGYQIIAPNREFYIQGGAEQDNASYITEIQFPVQKA